VVEDGDTEREPLVLTLPIPGLIDTLVAFEVLHFRVEDLPLSMVVGLKLKLPIVGAGFGFGGAFPVTLTLSSSVPCTRPA